MDRREILLKKSYSRTLKVLEERNLEPLFSFNEWSGCTDNRTRKGVYYRVRCKVCGTEYETTFSGNWCSKCPGCSKGIITSPKSVFIIVKQHLNEFNLEPLFSESEYKGMKYGLEYRVRCRKCGTEYFSTISKSQVRVCPVCIGSRNKKNSYIGAVEFCKKNNLTPLFSEKDYKGFFSKEHKYVYYPVKCDICGAEFKTYFSHVVVTCPKCKISSRASNLERNMTAYLKSHGINCMQSFRDHNAKNPQTGRRFDIDIYCPDFKIGFEFNGCYYHNCGDNEYGKNKEYHKDKYEQLRKEGITLYQIWDNIDDEGTRSIIDGALSLLPEVKPTSLAKSKYSDLSKFIAKNKLFSYDVSALEYVSILSDGELVGCVGYRVDGEFLNIEAEIWNLKFQRLKFSKSLMDYFTTNTLNNGVKCINVFRNRDICPISNDLTDLGFKSSSVTLLKWWWTKNNLKVNELVQITSREHHYMSDELIRRASLVVKSKGLSVNSLTDDEILLDAGMDPCYNSGLEKFEYELM